MKTIIDFANKVRSLADGRISNIANVEGATSAHPYTVGKQLIFNGLLCKATSAIAVGDTLAVGTNLALADNVVEQIYSLNQGLTNSLNNEIATRAKLGGHNLFKVAAETLTIQGVTFTRNSDGSFTVNGTASGNIYYNLTLSKFLKFEDLDYILTGCPSGGSEDSYSLFIRSNEADSSQWQYAIDYGNGVSFLADSSREYIAFMYVKDGYTISNKTFYPMIRLATDESTDYEPYSMTNREMTPYVQSISNPNLLDNPWFTVNQRGQSVYTSENYTVDRWRLSYATGATTHQATVNNDNSITLECEGTNNTYFRQKIENELLSGNDYTVSIKCRNIIGSPNFQICFSDGTYGITHIVTGPLYTYTIQNLLKNSTGIIFNIHPGESITIEAVKIEKGSISTLAMDTAPNYQQELAKCQRYFVRFNPTDSFTALGAGIYSSNHVFAEVTLPTVLRAKPNVSYSTIRAYSYGRNDVNISSIIVNNYINNIVSLKCAPGSGANFVNGDYCELQLDTNNYLDLSCEL